MPKGSLVHSSVDTQESTLHILTGQRRMLSFPYKLLLIYNAIQRIPILSPFKCRVYHVLSVSCRTPQPHPSHRHSANPSPYRSHNPTKPISKASDGARVPTICFRSLLREPDERIWKSLHAPRMPVSKMLNGKLDGPA